MIEQIRKARLITAIKTPFLENGDIDLKSFDKLIEKQIEAGVQGLIIGGTTGEGHLMDWPEHIMLIAHSVNKYGKDIIIVGNTGSNNTKEAIEATHQGFATGMHASLLINPYYGKTSKEGILYHLEKTLDLGPAFIYNVAGRTAQDITPDIMTQVAKHENFIGVKECSGNERIQEYEKQGIACWSGNDDQAFDAVHSNKGHGVISVFSNLFPKTMKKMIEDDSFSVTAEIKEMMDWLFHEPNPIPLNTACALVGYSKPVFRLPYVPVSEEQQRKFIELLSKMPEQEVVASETIPKDKFTLC